MRIGILASLAVHGAAGTALALFAISRQPAAPALELKLAVRATAPAVEQLPPDPTIPEPPRDAADPFGFPEEAPEPEQFEAPLEEPFPGPGPRLPARMARLLTPLRRPVRATPAPPPSPPIAGRAAAKGEISPPRLREDLSPEARYPARARRMGLEGTVVLLLCVAQDGTVAKTEIATSSGHEELDRAAADAAKLWRFEPARRDGEAIEYDVRVPVEFRLTDA